MKLITLFLTLLSSTAFAGHKSDISCDSGWKICLQSDSSVQGVPLVTSIETTNGSVNLFSQSFKILIQSDSQVVLSNGGKQIVIGTVSEAVGDDAQYAFSRELVLNQGIGLNISKQNGPQVHQCNPTAAGIVYEKSTYNTVQSKLVITSGSQVLAAVQSQSLVEPPLETHPSLIPCK